MRLYIEAAHGSRDRFHRSDISAGSDFPSHCTQRVTCAPRNPDRRLPGDQVLAIRRIIDARQLSAAQEAARGTLAMGSALIAEVGTGLWLLIVGANLSHWNTSASEA